MIVGLAATGWMNGRSITTVQAADSKEYVTITNKPLLDLIMKKFSSDKDPNKLTQKDLDSVQSLWISDKNITSLKDIDKLHGLKQIFIENEEVTDLSPISSVTSLEYVLIQFPNEIKDITPLKGLKNLKELSMSGVEINSTNQKDYMDTISSLTGLTYLSCWHCNIQQDQTVMFEPLKNLTILSLSGNYITNLDFLSGREEKLTGLGLSGNPIGNSEVDKLKGFYNLEALSIMDTQVTDLGIMSTLPKLKSGYARGEIGYNVVGRDVVLWTGVKAKYKGHMKDGEIISIDNPFTEDGKILEPESSPDYTYNKDTNEIIFNGYNNMDMLSVVYDVTTKTGVILPYMMRYDLVRGDIVTPTVPETQPATEATSKQAETQTQPVSVPESSTAIEKESTTVQEVTSTAAESTTAQEVTSTAAESTTAQEITSTAAESTTAQEKTSTAAESTTAQEKTSTAAESTTAQEKTSTAAESTTAQTQPTNASKETMPETTAPVTPQTTTVSNTGSVAKAVVGSSEQTIQSKTQQAAVTTKNQTPKTADTVNMVLPEVTICVAGGLVAVLGFRRKKNK